MPVDRTRAASGGVSIPKSSCTSVQARGGPTALCLGARCDVFAFQDALLSLRPQVVLFRDALSQGVPSISAARIVGTQMADGELFVPAVYNAAPALV
jgi:hypothetical protein